MFFKKIKDAKFARELERARYTNVDGNIISMHHAFKTIRFTRMSKFSVIVLPILFMVNLWQGFGTIAEIWGYIIEFWMQHLFAGGQISHRTVTILWNSFRLPYPALSAGYPTEVTIFFNFFGTIIIYMFSAHWFKKWAPFIYLVRAAMMVQWSASMYFLINPNYFPYELGGYIVDMLSLGLYLLFLVPLVYAAILYIFDFPLWWKMLVTFVTLAFFIIFLPCQYMVHAWIVHQTSYMFLPLLYFMFAVLLDVLMFICFYSIAMAWSPYKRNSSDLGRYA